MYRNPHNSCHYTHTAFEDIDWDFESKKIVAVGEGGTLMAKVFIWDTGNSTGDIVGHNKPVLSVA